VILDLPRPGSSGRDVCKKIANLIPGLPVLTLSGSSDGADKVLLLEMGPPAAIPIARVLRLISTSRLVGAVIVLLGVVVTAFFNSDRSRSMTRL
jgi:CheY-like chemotaxis protein